MLMAWAKVNKKGEFSLQGDPSISYTTLIPERIFLAGSAFISAAKALTIACRYSCVRTQGANDQKIIDYQTHYTALLPAVAVNYALNTAIRYMS
jgi:acyl-CoA oxidase